MQSSAGVRLIIHLSLQLASARAKNSAKVSSAGGFAAKAIPSLQWLICWQLTHIGSMFSTVTLNVGKFVVWPAATGLL